jgi:hypothetical protein
MSKSAALALVAAFAALSSTPFASAGERHGGDVEPGWALSLDLDDNLAAAPALSERSLAGWPAAAAALSLVSLSAAAAGHDRIADGDGWDLSLYGAQDGDGNGGLPGGGLALSLHPGGGWPSAAFSIDYAADDGPVSAGSGLGLLASVDLLDSAIFGSDSFMRLSYRLGAGFSPTGGGEDGQTIALRAGLKW